MKSRLLSITMTAALFLGLGSLKAFDNGKISKTFPAKPKLYVKTVSGDCIIKQGAADKISVEVVSDVKPQSAFSPRFDEQSDRLKLSEDWTGSSSGSVTWTITIPKGTEVEFSTASGDFSGEGLENNIESSSASGDVTLQNSKGKVDISTASGDVEITNSNGELDISTASGDVSGSGIQGTVEMKTASGDIDLKDAKGSVELKCASGDIDVSNLIMESSATVSTASGDVEIGLAQSPASDLSLSSASGNIELDYNGNPVKGTFIFTARKDHGRIQAPFSFDHEEEFEQNGKTYVKKSFTRDTDKPVITLETATGTVKLNK